MTKFMTFLATLVGLFFTGLAHACPDASQPAEEVLDVFTLNQAQQISISPGKAHAIGECEDLGVDFAAGYIGAAPSFALNLQGDQAEGLAFGTRGSCDLNMLIEGPDGTFAYNDDAGSALQPFFITDGVAGEYLVWVGQFDETADCTGDLILTPGTQICPSPDMVSGSTLGLNAETLADGQTLTLTAGGVLDLAGCEDVRPDDTFPLGFAPLAPQVDFVVTQASDARLNLNATSVCDTSLLAQTSDGTWYFNDDANTGFDPQLSLPLTGIDNIRVWLGIYGNVACEAELTLSGGTAGALAGACPAMGTEALTTYNIDEGGADLGEFPMGGSQDVLNCDGDVADAFGTGFFDGTPSVNVTVGDEGADFLLASANSSCDGVMLAVDPAGDWYFNDDSFGVDPALSFDDLIPGTYSIWLGTYNEEADCSGTLMIDTQAPACPNPALAANEAYDFGVSDLAAGVSLPVVAGGYTDASLCESALGDIFATGNFIDRPDFALDLDLGNGQQVQLATQASCDTVLLVQDPSGAFTFDDDGGVGEEDSLIALNEGSGLYNVWIGTYGDDLCEGSLELRRGLSK